MKPHIHNPNHKKIHRPRPVMNNSRPRPTETKSTDQRSKGTLQQLEDKYLTLARETASSGDRVASESYYQHADHYHRLIQVLNESQQQQQLQQQQQQQHRMQREREQQQFAAADEPTTVQEAISAPVDTNLVQASSPETELQLALI